MFTNPMLFRKITISNRNIGGYRYSFQGQEKDPETGKEAFQLRLWDGRIGRWLTTDPYGQYSSPYVGMGNNPVNGTDPDGGKFFDWVREKGSSLFYWDNNVHSESEAIAKGVIYGGKTIREASMKYNSSFNFFEKLLNKNNHTFNYDSYRKSIGTPIAMQAIEMTKEKYTNYKIKNGEVFVRDITFKDALYPSKEDDYISIRKMEVRGNWSDVIVINKRKMLVKFITAGGNIIDRTYFRHNVKPDNQSWLKITNGGGYGVFKKKHNIYK